MKTILTKTYDTNIPEQIDVTEIEKLLDAEVEAGHIQKPKIEIEEIEDDLEESYNKLTDWAQKHHLALERLCDELTDTYPQVQQAKLLAYLQSTIKVKINGQDHILRVKSKKDTIKQIESHFKSTTTH